MFGELPPNLYDMDRGRFGEVHLMPGLMEVDEVVPIPNPSAEKAKDLATRFVAGEFDESLASMGLLKKMAMLLWGDPGTSKSVTVFEIVGDAIRKGWVVLRASADLSILVETLRAIRQVQPDLGIMVIWEEFEDVVTHREHAVLELLDGSHQIPGVFYLMTTNYIQTIPARIFFRMRRIPFQVQFHFPGEAERRAYFSAKIPAERRDEIDLDVWVEKTDGFSLDQCAQVILAVFAFNLSIESVMEDLAERKAAHGGRDMYDSDEKYDDEDEWEGEELMAKAACPEPMGG